MTDLLATVAVAVVLLGVGLWNLMTVATIPLLKEVFAELALAELPLLSRLVFQASELYLFQILSIALLLTGFGLLFATRDRLRGVVHGLVIAMLIAILTVIVKEATWLPIVKVIQSVNQ